MYYHFESDETTFNKKLNSSRCEHTKDDGLRCKNNVVIGQQFCHHHRKIHNKAISKPSTIPNAGVGLFAFKKNGRVGEIIFRSGDRVGKYGGEIINEAELIRRYGTKTAPYTVQLRRGLYADAGAKRSLMSMINHSETRNNCRFSVGRDNRANVVAIKDIKFNKELFLDYGDEYKMDEDTCSSTNRSKYTC